MNKKKYFRSSKPVHLLQGGTLTNLEIAYQCFGCPLEEAERIIVVLHALSGSSQVIGDEEEAGWWDSVFDLDSLTNHGKNFAICPNLLGSYYGSSGPCSHNPKTGVHYGADFPWISTKDIVETLRQLVFEHFEITTKITLLGGSLGGMVALQWAVDHPADIETVIALATPGKSYPQTRAFRCIQREIVMLDPAWQNGKYPLGTTLSGLGVARKLGLVTYRSDEEFLYRFSKKGSRGVETYLDHQAEKFKRRFDANSYLRLSQAMDWYDLSLGYHSLEEALDRVSAEVYLLYFDTDFLCRPYQIESLAKNLQSLNKSITLCAISSIHGHDAFLLEKEAIISRIRPILDTPYLS